MKSPEFWERGKGSWPSIGLRPLGWLYQLAGWVREATTTGERLSVSVICVGNVVAGGAGKTPVSLAIAQYLQTAGVDVRFLSRGYGGTEQGPHRVNAEKDGPSRVGDEPLLLARMAPTWVAKNRRRGATSCIDAGAEIIVMDDGLQNPSLIKDVTFCVIDGAYGLGNGHIMPSGPLREPVSRALKKSTAVVLMGEDHAGMEVFVHKISPEIPILKASLKPVMQDIDLAGRAVHAFAGIGQPDKFFNTLRELGCDVLETTAFADHHAFTDIEIEKLIAAASADKALLLTTEKDYVRLEPKWHSAIQALPVTLVWQDHAMLEMLLKPYVPEVK